MRPISRDELVRRLKRLGFSGPFSGGKHQFMKRGALKLRIPNPHQSDITGDLLKRLLEQAELTNEWNETQAH